MARWEENDNTYIVYKNTTITTNHLYFLYIFFVPSKAYLEGWDTWSEIGGLTSDVSTQPAKISLVDVQDPFHNDMYWSKVSFYIVFYFIVLFFLFCG